MQPLISVIIPIYNVESYLRRCLDSVLRQTYSNLEIILVDDGSPDNCPSICDEYANNDTRIVVIHKKNGGLSDARNAGLDICRGDYITFVDSDDWVNEKYVERLITIANKRDADLVIGEHKKTGNGINLEDQQNHYEKEFSNKEAIRILFENKCASFTMSCGKLYKKNLFETIRFPLNKYHEDNYTTYLIFYNTKKIVYTTQVLYYYFQREGSITSTSHPWDVLEFLNQQVHFFEEKQENEILVQILPQLCWQYLCAYGFEKNHQKANEFLFHFKKNVAKLTKFKIRKTKLLALIFFSKFPHLYIIYRKYSPFHIRKKL